MQKKQLDAYIEELIAALQKLTLTHKKNFQYKQLEKYFGTELQILGLSMGDQQLLFKEKMSFSALDLNVQLEIYDAAWQYGKMYELRFQPIFFLKRYCKKLDPKIVLQIVAVWMDTVDCWPHSDELAKIICIAGVKIPNEYKGMLQKWNTSSNPWNRRQSVVALVREKTAFKGIFSREELEILFVQLLDDKVYMIQRGLGWALRDTGRIYPKEHQSFLFAHVHALSSVAFATATEKILPEVKEELKLLRKFKTSSKKKQ